ncbi:MAG: S8 family serine peptidase [Anaerolineae bacterium]|nr:S8 family serine peptidase [Anaerolineae bacterium]
MIVTLCLVAWISPVDAALAPATVVVRLDADAYQEALALGMVPVHAVDYIAFAWVELLPAARAHLRNAGVPYTTIVEPFVLTLGEERFDPVRDRLRLSAGWEVPPGQGAGLYLVQFAGPIRDEWLARVRSGEPEYPSGELEIVQYIHPFTYVVWGDPVALAACTQAQEVRWVGTFAPAFKVLPQWRDLPDQAVAVDVLLYRGAGEEETLHALQLLSSSQAEYAAIDDRFGIASLDLPGDAFIDAAGIPGVYSIQPRPTSGGLRGEVNNQVNVDNVDESGHAFPGYRDWLAGVDLDGSGVVIANVDSGVYQAHPDLVNRVVTCLGQTCGDTAYSMHGTHTAGIMAADGSSGLLDRGFLRGLGVAPGASLVEQLYYPTYTQPGGMLILMADSYENGAFVSGNSWGPSDLPRGYDEHTRQVDVGVRDADTVTPGNQALMYVVSVMNGYGGYQSQGTPDEAKNILAVGSTQMQHTSGAQTLDVDDLSGNTAHGPCLDGRNTPQLVAPGCAVDSTTVSGHDLLCGTSMASPNVSGAVALFVEYYRRLAGVDPSPALVKAAFLPVAHDLAGHHDADGNLLGHPFDSKQGWGRLDVRAVVAPAAPVLYYDNPQVLDETGEVWGIEIVPADPEQAVRLMLTWTDAPGHGLGGSTPAWNNDLDLVVDTGLDSYAGNAFGADGWSQPGGIADPRNNTEGVFFPSGSVEHAVVRVVAANITSDGIPGQGDETDQDFALACYNCREQGDFSLTVTPPAMDACLNSTVTGTISVREIAPYQEPVQLEVGLLPAGVTAECDPWWAMPPGESTLTLSVGEAPTGTYTLVLSATGAMNRLHTAPLDLWLHDRPPGQTVPQVPADGASYVEPGSVTFQWQATPEAWTCRLQVSQDPAFGTLDADAVGLPGTDCALAIRLDPLTCYYWRVRGENACGPGEWSPLVRFCTGPLVTRLPLITK